MAADCSTQQQQQAVCATSISLVSCLARRTVVYPTTTSSSPRGSVADYSPVAGREVSYVFRGPSVVAKCYEYCSRHETELREHTLNKIPGTR